MVEGRLAVESAEGISFDVVLVRDLGSEVGSAWAVSI